MMRLPQPAASMPWLGAGLGPQRHANTNEKLVAAAPTQIVELQAKEVQP